MAGPAGRIPASTPAVYNTHLLSEPLFLFLSVLVAATFVEHLLRPRLPLLLASGIILGLAALTRHVYWGPRSPSWWD